MDFLPAKLLHGFVKVVTWICQNVSMYFLHFEASALNFAQCLGTYVPLAMFNHKRD